MSDTPADQPVWASTRRSAGSARCWSARPARPPTADPDQLRRVAVRRRDVGRPGPEDHRSSWPPCATGASRWSSCTRCWPRCWPGPRPDLAARPQDRPHRGRHRAGRRDPVVPRRARRPTLAEFVIGGLATTDLPGELRPGYVALARDHSGARDYLMPPCPTRCTPGHHLLDLRRRHPQPAVLAGPPRRDAAHEGAVPVPRPGRRHHLVGRPEVDWGLATFEGGDVMPAGNGVVLVGMSERTSRQAITLVAKALFDEGAAERVVVAGMPSLRPPCTSTPVFTFADRDVAPLPRHRRRHRAVLAA